MAKQEKNQVSSRILKQDINFLEYPLWVQDYKEGEGYIWKDIDGYVYQTAYKPPTKVDALFLYYLLYVSQQQGWQEEIRLSRYQVLKACGCSNCQYWQKRFKEALIRWENVRIHFQGTFFDGIAYETLSFGIIDAWGIERDGKIFINFSPLWLKRIKESLYFQNIDFNEIKKLRSPLVFRLYEILCKNFHGRDAWEIDAVKLAKKIPMAFGNVSHIVAKIKRAVIEINKETDLQIDLEIKRPKRGKASFVFQSIKHNPLPDILPLMADQEEQAAFMQLRELIPVAYRTQKTICTMLLKYLRKEGFTYVKRNIAYTNKFAKRNYRLFLQKALKEDWAGTWWEEERERQVIEGFLRPGNFLLIDKKFVFKVADDGFVYECDKDTLKQVLRPKILPYAEICRLIKEGRVKVLKKAG